MKLLKTKFSEIKGNIIYLKQSNIQGQLTEVMYNANNDPQYAVIATSYFSGNKERYFAIPAMPVFLNLNNGNSVALNLSKNDLIFAKRIHFSDCPSIKENSFFPQVYEVYGYKSSSKKQPKRKAI